MSGRKSTIDTTYLTARATYRTDIEAADASPDLNTIPEIRLDVDETKLHYDEVDCSIEPKYEASGRAYNGHLELFIYYTPDTDECDPSAGGLVDGVLNQADTRCHADIRVWAWGEPDDGEVEGRWTLVHEQSVLGDTLIPLRDIPNAKYKVTVAFINGGTVDIVEQHTV